MAGWGHGCRKEEKREGNLRRRRRERGEPPRHIIPTHGRGREFDEQEEKYGSKFVYNAVSGEYCVPEGTLDIADIQSFRAAGFNVKILPKDDEIFTEKIDKDATEENVKKDEVIEEKRSTSKIPCPRNTNRKIATAKRRHAIQLEPQPCTSASVLGSVASKPGKCEKNVNNKGHTRKPSGEYDFDKLFSPDKLADDPLYYRRHRSGMLLGSDRRRVELRLRQQYPDQQSFFRVNALQAKQVANKSLLRDNKLTYFKPYVHHSCKVVFADKSEELKIYLSPDFCGESPMETDSDTFIQADSHTEPCLEPDTCGDSPMETDSDTFIYADCERERPETSDSKTGDNANRKKISESPEAELKSKPEESGDQDIWESIAEEQSTSESESHKAQSDERHGPNSDPDSQDSASPKSDQITKDAEEIDDEDLDVLFQVILETLSSATLLDIQDPSNEEETPSESETEFSQREDQSETNLSSQCSASPKSDEITEDTQEIHEEDLDDDALFRVFLQSVSSTTLLDIQDPSDEQENSYESESENLQPEEQSETNPNSDPPNLEQVTDVREDDVEDDTTYHTILQSLSSSTLLEVMGVPDEQESASELESENAQEEELSEPDPSSQPSGPPEQEQVTEDGEEFIEEDLDSDALHRIMLESLSSTMLLEFFNSSSEEEE